MGERKKLHQIISDALDYRNGGTKKICSLYIFGYFFFSSPKSLTSVSAIGFVLLRGAELRENIQQRNSAPFLPCPLCSPEPGSDKEIRQSFSRDCFVVPRPGLQIIHFQTEEKYRSRWYLISDSSINHSKLKKERKKQNK